MTLEELLYLPPYLISLLLSFGIFIYAWLHRRVRGARAYTWFMAGQTLSIFGFIMELISPNLEIKIVWDKFQWLTQAMVIVAYLAFAIQFTEHKLRHPGATWGILIAFPLIFNILVVTDGFHHLIYPDPHLNAAQPFSELEYSFTAVVYIYSLYVYGATFYGIGLLVRRAVQPFNVHRVQFAVIAVGFLIPVALSIFALFDIKITPQRDSTPFTFAMGNLIVAWGLFRYRVFDIAPIARERVMENMADPVIVLDAGNRVVDINQAALSRIGRKGSEVIGQPNDEIFSEWGDLVEKFADVEEGSVSISVEIQGGAHQFEVSVSPIFDRQRQLIGRVFVAHDVTRIKYLEEGYRLLAGELEQRVKERTDELRQTAERYRALFEQTNDAIFILDLQGRHLDANRRAADMLGYTHEEIMGLSFRETSAEITKSEQVLERLLRGEHIPVYERTFRKKGGELIPVEINLELVRGLDGAPLHIQSAVRDISERKRAEEALRHSAEQYRAVVENQTEFIVRWRDDGIRTFVNEAYCRYFGLTPEQALSVSFMTQVAEEDRPALEARIARLRSGVVNSETEIHRVIKPDGSIGWQEWTDQAIHDETGRIVEFQSVGRDVSERKLAEEMILKQFSFDTLMTRLLTDFVTCSHNQVDTSIENALKEIAKFFEGDYADILLVSDDKRSWISTHHWIAPGLEHDVRPTARIPIGTLKWSEGKLLRGESIRIHSLDDYPPEAHRERQFGEEEGAKSLVSVPIRGRGESVYGVMDIVSYNRHIKWSDSDITHLRIVGDAIANTLERARAETALRKSEERFSKAFQSAPVIITIAKVDDGRLMDVNRTFEEFVGYKREEAIGKTTTELGLWENPSEREQLLPLFLANGEIRNREIQFRTRDGRSITGLVSAELIELNGIQCNLAVIEDITERKLAEKNLEEAYESTLEGWARALELRDKETEGHSRRVTETTLAVARAMGVPEDELVHVRRGAILHDIGKMGIPDEILRKPGKLTSEERRIVKEHPNTARKLLSHIPFLKKALEIPYCHHEKWDGTGYPQGLKGEEIPLSARIFAVADVWDALSSDRPYRQAWKTEKVIEYLRSQSGRYFDPVIVNTFLALVEKGGI
jgi:PAS domain S-box-containing protein/putative nucleotidyltransferase with HDIG domain